MPTPCTLCQTCLSRVTKEFIAPWLYELDGGRLADAFSLYCAAAALGDGNVTRCTAVAASVRNSGANGNAGKRAALVCQGLGECNATLLSSTPGGCWLTVLRLTSSTTMLPSNQSTTALDLCTAEGVPLGTRLPGITASLAELPPGTCRANADCAIPGTVCNMSGARAVCACVGGEDVCVNIGACRQTPCARCAGCVAAMQAFVHAPSTEALMDAGTLASAFYAACLASRQWTASLCFAARTAVEGSHNGNLGRRAAAVCAALGDCNVDSSSLGSTCRYVLPPEDRVMRMTLYACIAKTKCRMTSCANIRVLH
jgi:hypothetical protein